MRWDPAVAAALVLASLAGCVGASFDSVPSAGWKAGNSFSYTFSAEADFESTLTRDGEVIDHDEQHDGGEPPARLSYRVLSTQMTHAGDPLYLVLVNGDRFTVSASPSGTSSVEAEPGLTGLLGVRQRDLQPMATEVLFPNGCLACAEASFRPDRDDYSWIRFPLTKGDTWSGRIAVESGPGVDGVLFVESRVEGISSVPGPQGPVDAILIRHTLEMAGVEELEAKLRREAAAFGVTLHSLDLEHDDTADVHFAPSLRNVVKQELRLRLSLEVEFEEGGKRFHGEAKGSLTMRTNLVAADLSEGPELTLEQAVAALTDPPELPELPDPPAPDPQKPAEPASGSLRLRGSAQVVNAADSPVVQFATDALGSARPTSYEVRAADGTLVSAGGGGQFTFTVREPGTYTATVFGRDGNGRGLSASAPLAADYTVVVDAGCPTVAALSILMCGEAAVPVRPGVASLTARAVRTSHAGEPGLGVLRLTEPDGRIHDASMSGNEAEIRLDELVGGVADWRLRYAPTAGVAESVQYAVHLSHSGSPPAWDVALGPMRQSWLSLQVPGLLPPPSLAVTKA